LTIQGVNPVRKVRADGSVEWLYYAWRGRGAPCFWKSPHKPVKHPYPRQFIAAYQKAIEEHRAPTGDDFDGIAQKYLAGRDFTTLADKTQKEYRKYVDDARTQFGNATLNVMSDPRFRAEILRYRDSLALRPRAADLAVLGVQMVLEHGRNLGLLGTNLAAGIPSLYQRPDDKRPWTADELRDFADGCEPHVLDAFNLIRLLAIRRKDAIEITWAADRGTHIAWGTSKGARHRREAIIPIIPEARTFLDSLRKRNMDCVTMLATLRGRPWVDAASITKAFRARWIALGRKDESPTPHRLRNNAATTYLIAGLDERTIADAMGWSVRDVEEMRRVYVDREAVVSAAVIRLRAGNSTGTRKPSANRVIHRAKKPNGNGEPAGGRTRDHLIKSQVLYQLSYRLSQSGGT
jgi:hypothetical protein